jgi:type II secretory pathway pseudopilin PulG
MMVVVVFMMVLLIIASLATVGAIKTSLKRDREEEMIHRGVQYARAIKKYYRKFGRYPANLEALDDTNHIRFLRKRYKDPFAKDGKWIVLRYGQVRFGQQGGPGFTNTGQPGLPNVPGVTSMFGGGGQSTGGLGQSTGGFGQNTGGDTALSSFGQNSGGQQGQSFGGGFGGNQQGGGDPTGGNAGAPGVAIPAGSTGINSSGGGLGAAIGGGAVIGVASPSEEQSLRIVADKNHYKDWAFVYDPTLDRGGLINGPYDPKRALGMRSGQLGQQIGQPIGQQIGTPVGQQPGTNTVQPQDPTQPTQVTPQR